MRVEIRGQPEKISRAEVRAAVQWYAIYLLGLRLARRCHLRLLFKQGLRRSSGIWAQCYCRDQGQRPRQFVIEIDAGVTRDATLINLAHEMVHVKQFARRELIAARTAPPLRWRGQHCSEDLHYYERPWEIEAYGREYGIYHLWRESQRRSATRPGGDGARVQRRRQGRSHAR